MVCPIPYGDHNKNHSGDWLFALPLADSVLQIEAWWWGSKSWCWSETWSATLCSRINAVAALWSIHLVSTVSCANVPRADQLGIMHSCSEWPDQRSHRVCHDQTEKRPDSLTLIPWQAGRAIAWDVTVCCPLAESYVEAAAREAGEVAEIAAACKSTKYAELEDRYIFQHIAVE